MARAHTRRKTQGATVEFSHLDKVFYPKTGFTKGDVIRYYLDVAQWLLPHLAQRPVTLKRFPEGIRGPYFYEKDAPGFTPDWVPTFPVPRRDGGEPIRYILINDARVLAWCANLGTIELHPFLHRAPAIASPTAITFDLDPGEGADLRDCARVGLEVKAVLERVKLRAFAKVSGSKGLQVYVPLNTAATYDATQAFAKTVAELLHRRHPERIVSEMPKALRKGRVFIDWSQNSDFKTTVGVYSLRAKRSEPYASMPITWDEVEGATARRGSEALQFAPAAALARLARHGDLFAPVLTVQQQLPDAFAELGSPAPKRPRALRAYAEKRNFGQTPEPGVSPRRSAQGSRRRFVVQKHAASHLHYDFRLEVGETLKSWAVPKGVPVQLDERHSAFATEDHPLEYLDFEGVIPAGQYGGGTVMVWDIGSYDVIDGNYWQGFLRVFLRGKKLKGEWTLQRVEERDGKARWLIVKTGAAMKPISAARENRSVLTGRTMEAIAEARDAVWESNRESDGRTGMVLPERAEKEPRRKTKAVPTKKSPSKRRRIARRPQSEIRNSPAPLFVAPMLARAVAQLPEGADWIYEVKWDGYRAVALKHGDAVQLRSRKNNRMDADFPGVAKAIRGIHAESAALDGEIVAVDENGRPQFQLLQNRASRRGSIVFYAYDLLQLDGADLRALPLETRKAKLAAIIAGTDVRLSADLPGRPAEILAEAQRLGLEGIVAKRRDAPYESGERSGAWQKLKLSPEQEFVVGGFKPGNPLESLLVGYYQDGKLMFAGKVRQGLNPRNRVELHRALRPLRSDECPFANLPNSTKSHFGEGVTPAQMQELCWARPKLVAQVSFTEWTSSGNLRHATYKGLRTDKTPKQVRREALAASE